MKKFHLTHKKTLKKAGQRKSKRGKNVKHKKSELIIKRSATCLRPAQKQLKEESGSAPTKTYLRTQFPDKKHSSLSISNWNRKFPYPTCACSETVVRIWSATSKSSSYTFSAQKTLTLNYSTLNRKLQYPNTRLLRIRCQNRDQHPRKPYTVRFQTKNSHTRVETCNFDFCDSDAC